MTKSLSLREWIIETGEVETARLLKAGRSTVRHWRRGYCLPRPEQMQAITKFSRGRVSYEEMIETFNKNKKNGARA